MPKREGIRSVRKIEVLARLISKEFGGCFIPSNCWEKDIPLTRCKAHEKFTYRSINKEHKEERKAMIVRASKLLKSLIETNLFEAK